jgi:hypothetical protein
MRSTLLAAGLALVCASLANAQTGGKAAIEKALIANEHKLNDAVVKHDATTFNTLVAADAISADMGGITNVSDFVKSMDQAKIQTYQIVSPRVVWIDDKSAVVVYTWKGKGTWMNEPVPETTYVSSVWAERGGKWVVVYHQETGAAPASPASSKKH